jgi:hypothetical protein
MTLYFVTSNKIHLRKKEEMYQLSGSYEALFSKKAQLYKSMNLKDKSWLKKTKKIHFRALYFWADLFCH